MSNLQYNSLNDFMQNGFISRAVNQGKSILFEQEEVWTKKVAGAVLEAVLRTNYIQMLY